MVVTVNEGGLDWRHTAVSRCLVSILYHHSFTATEKEREQREKICRADACTVVQAMYCDEKTVNGYENIHSEINKR